MNQVTFTRYKSPDPLSKVFYAEDGVLKKVASALFVKGSAERISMPFSDVPALFDALSGNEALGWGVHSLALPEKIKITLSGRENPASNLLARTKEHYGYRGAGVLMLDHDASQYGRSYSRDELLAVLKEIHPAMQECAMFIRGSVSSGVHLEGELPTEGKGFHIYIPVTDASLIPAYGALLHRRLWLSGQGYIALSSVGSKRVCACLDNAVYSPERLDFAGQPIIRGTGVKYSKIPTQYYEGGLLDLSSLSELNEDEVSVYQCMVADAKSAIAGDALAKESDCKASKVSEMVAGGASLEKATQTVNQIFSGGCQDLYSGFVLEFTHGKFTVADVLADPKRFNSMSLADPFEGSSYGRTTAKFYWNDGKPVINSLAHGQKLQYFLHLSPVSIELAQPSALSRDKPDWVIDLAEHVERWNKTHASTLSGGKHRIMRFEPSSATHDGRESFTFFNRDELSRVFDNTSIKIGEKTVKGKVVDIDRNHVMAWSLDYRSNSFTGGVVFLPASTAPASYFNTWRGLSVKPVSNDALLNRIHYHLREVVCAGHDDLYDYAMKWIAYTFQHPDKPAGAALVLRGEKGSGKGTLGHFLKSIWGNHGLHITNAKHLVGNFNGHLNDVCFLFADEAFFSGDKQHEGVLKGLITEPSVVVERKGIDAISQPNYLKIFMATNAEFAVPASRDERRYCVLDVSSSHIGNRQYFTELHADCASKDVQSAFLHQMLEIDLTDWHSGMIPDSVGLREQRYHSMHSAQHWLVDSLLNGSFKEGNISYGWTEKMQSSELYTAYQGWAVLNKISEYRMFNQCRLMTYLNKIYQFAKHVNGRGRRGVRFGTLDNAVAAFEGFEKVSLAELASDRDDAF